jgi:hypothetical protein
MLETAEKFEKMMVVLGGALWVGHAGLPQVLVEKRNVFLDRYWEISILTDIPLHSFSHQILILI